jgi:hypothetical protein
MENRIIAFIGVCSCIILANIVEGIIGWLWAGLAIVWVVRYLTIKE